MSLIFSDAFELLLQNLCLFLLLDVILSDDGFGLLDAAADLASGFLDFEHLFVDQLSSQLMVS